jgi:hypothetical protein
MAIPNWPAAPFPQNPQRGYRENVGINVVRSSMDAGPAKQLQNWIENTIYGVKRFNFLHPRTKATVECRLVPQGENEFFTIEYIAPDYYTAQLRLEILP